MKTLLTLFNEQRSEIQTEINKATSPEQVVKLVQNRLNGLERTYIGGELSVAQVRLVSFFLETLRQSVAALTAANATKVPKPEAQLTVLQAPYLSNKMIFKGLEGLVGVGILGSLFSLTQTAPGAWMSILLVSLLVGLEVLQFDKGERGTLALPEGKEASQPIVKIDSQTLLDNIADALNTIDQAIASAREVKKTLDSSGIEELPELLNFLQRLLGASSLEKPHMMVELTKLLPQILMEQGIHAQIYRPNAAHNQREYFDFEPSIDPSTQDYVTITPALLKGDQVLRRGRVIEPANSVKD